jgi:hypothetical protein
MARAAAADSDTARAEVLFREGRELMAAEKFAEACAAFDASQKLEPTVATMLNQAACREKNGELATAWGLFLDAERKTRTAIEEDGKQLHEAAVDRAARLERRVSKLQLNVAPANRVAGLQITNGAALVDPDLWNRGLPVDGGSYAIKASAPEHEPWTTTVVVRTEGDTQVVEVPLLARVAAPIPIERPPSVAVAVTPRPHPRRLIFGLGAGGIATLGGALVLELWSRDTYAQSETEPNDTSQHALWQSANHERYAAEACAVLGAASVGVAIWLYFRREPGGTPARVGSLAIEPTLGGVQLRW